MLFLVFRPLLAPDNLRANFNPLRRVYALLAGRILVSSRIKELLLFKVFPDHKARQYHHPQVQSSCSFLAVKMREHHHHSLTRDVLESCALY